MRILIAYSSKHGATEEIARTIKQVVADNYSETYLSDVKNVGDVSVYDAVILGSAVYAGMWQKPARQFTERHHSMLTSGPLWTFSSGPLGDKTKPSSAEPIGQGIIDLMKKLQPIEHKVFYGKLDKSKLNFAEKGVVRMVKAPYGDYRDFNEISKWAKSIVRQLKKL